MLSFFWLADRHAARPVHRLTPQPPHRAVLEVAQLRIRRTSRRRLAGQPHLTGRTAQVAALACESGRAFSCGLAWPLFIVPVIAILQKFKLAFCRPSQGASQESSILTRPLKQPSAERRLQLPRAVPRVRDGGKPSVWPFPVYGQPAARVRFFLLLGRLFKFSFLANERFTTDFLPTVINDAHGHIRCVVRRVYHIG